MSKVTGGESNLLGGVSQQPVDRRLRGAVSEQINCITSVLRGIERRPPMQFIPVPVIAPAYAHTVWLDFVLAGEIYALRIQYDLDSTTNLLLTLYTGDGSIVAVDIDPTIIPYITSQDPEQMSITATSDGVYLLNPNIIPAMTSLTTLPPYGAYIDMTGTNYGRDYEIFIDDVSQAKVTIPADTTGLDPADIQSESIMEQLNTAFVNNAYTTNVKGSTMFLAPTDIYSYMNLRVHDGDNNNYLYVAQRVVPSVSKLPKAAVQNTILTVRPNNGGLESEYYLEYVDKQSLYENDTGTTPPPPDEIEFDTTHLLGSNKATLTSSLTARGYATVLGTSAASLVVTDFLGGTITDLVVTTTSNDTASSHFDQHITLRHINTNVVLPDSIEIEINNTAYTLETLDGNTYQSTANYDLAEFNPYAYLKLQGNNGTASIRLRNTNLPDFSDIFSGGIWVEAVQPGLNYQIDNTTMPIKLSYDMLTDTWAAATVLWADRRVGNNENNKLPSFIGAPINSLAFIHSRLCFLTDTAVVFSRVDKENDFWRHSATTVAADDRVDIESRLLDSGAFRTLTAHDKDIVIFGDNEQWVIPLINGLAPSSISLQLASRYDNDTSVPPVTLGASLAYPVWDGVYTHFREFYTRDDTGSNDSEELTSIIPTYIQGRVVKLASTTLNNMLVVQTDEPNTLYVMQWHTQNGVRVMQSWHKWIIPLTPEHIFFANGQLVIIVTVGMASGYYIMDPAIGPYRPFAVGDDPIPPSGYDPIKFDVYLDYRIELPIGSNNEIALVANHAYTEETTLVIGAEDSEYVGMSIPFTIVGDTLIVDDQLGSTLSGTWIIGNKFSTEITLSTLLPRDDEDQVMSEATLRLNNVKLRHSNSGEYDVTVTRNWGDYFNESFTESLDMSRLVGAAMLDAPLMHTGELHVPIRERSEFVTIEIKANGHLPYNLTGYDWSGQLSGSGQRRRF